MQNILSAIDKAATSNEAARIERKARALVAEHKGEAGEVANKAWEAACRHKESKQARSLKRRIAERVAAILADLASDPELCQACGAPSHSCECPAEPGDQSAEKSMSDAAFRALPRTPGEAAIVGAVEGLKDAGTAPALLIPIGGTVSTEALNAAVLGAQATAGATTSEEAYAALKPRKARAPRNSLIVGAALGAPRQPGVVSSGEATVVGVKRQPLEPGVVHRLSPEPWTDDEAATAPAPKARMERKPRAEGAKTSASGKTECAMGHPWTPENIKRLKWTDRKSGAAKECNVCAICSVARQKGLDPANIATLAEAQAAKRIKREG